MDRWFQTTAPLSDGWYWRKCTPNDSDPDVIEVCNGVMIDTQPIDSYGGKWEIYENPEFSGWWFWGPIECPGIEEEKWPISGYSF